MIKTIKFDLKLSDGTTLARLDDLEENLSPALFEHFHSGKLAKWLRVRKLEELADNVEALRTQHLDDKNELDVKLFKNLCEIFVSEVSEEDAREAVAEFQALPVVEIENEEIEESKSLTMIEQPKTKKFHVNEKLLYQVFLELTSKGFNSKGVCPGGGSQYVKGEVIATEDTIRMLKKMAIEIEDVLILDSLQGGCDFCLTSDCLVLAIDASFSYSCKVHKIYLKDIYYLNYMWRNLGSKDAYAYLVINQHYYLYKYHPDYRCNYEPLYKFLKDYLALNEIEDKFEQIEVK